MHRNIHAGRMKRMRWTKKEDLGRWTSAEIYVSIGKSYETAIVDVEIHRDLNIYSE